MCTIIEVVLHVVDFSQCSCKVFPFWKLFKVKSKVFYTANSSEENKRTLVKITERKMLMETKFIQLIKDTTLQSRVYVPIN